MSDQADPAVRTTSVVFHLSRHFPWLTVTVVTETHAGALATTLLSVHFSRRDRSTKRAT